MVNREVSALGLMLFMSTSDQTAYTSVDKGGKFPCALRERQSVGRCARSRKIEKPMRAAAK